MIRDNKGRFSDCSGEHNIKYSHGLCGTHEYSMWKSMKARCYRKTVINYIHYGGRGIKVCDEWIDNPAAFISYIKSLDNYGVNKLTLDRIDNDGNYEPGNLRWADKNTQLYNRRKYCDRSIKQLKTISDYICD